MNLPRPLAGKPGIFRQAAARRAVEAAARIRTLWRTYPREMTGLGLLGLIGAAAIAGSAGLTPGFRASAKAAPPAPPLMLIRPLAPAQAFKVNATIPMEQGPNPAAAPFRFTGNAAARAQALECLASAIYYEAGNQDEDGERAVAQVVLNRVRHPAFPASICGVVYEGSTRPTGCQFTFTCDGSLDRRPDADGWRRAHRIAEQALDGFVYGPVGWATHYHADYVVPDWASSLAKNAIVGAHIFYRWAGSWGQPDLFTRSYAGREPDAMALRNAALAAPHIFPALPMDAAAAAIAQIPGAQALPLTPSMRGDKRVAIRFNLAARKAADDAPHQDYADTFHASDNLKWSLSNAATGENEAPLGPATAATSAATGGNSVSR